VEEKLVISHHVTLGDNEAEIFCVRFSGDDRYVACGCADGKIKIYNLETNKMAFLLANQVLTEYEIMPITCLRWRPGEHKTQNVLVSVSADGTVNHWHVTSGKKLHTIEMVDENHLYALDYNLDGSQFSTAGKDYKIRVYDENTKSCI